MANTWCVWGRERAAFALTTSVRGKTQSSVRKLSRRDSTGRGSGGQPRSRIARTACPCSTGEARSSCNRSPHEAGAPEKAQQSAARLSALGWASGRGRRRRRARCWREEPMRPTPCEPCLAAPPSRRRREGGGAPAWRGETFQPRQVHCDERDEVHVLTWSRTVTL